MKLAKSKPFFHAKALVDDKKAVGDGTRVWAFAHVMKGARVGSDCNIGDHAFIETGAVVGDRVTIKNGVSVWSGVTLADDVFVGPNAAFTNDLWPVSRKQTPFVTTQVGKGACVGANATIVCGYRVGRYAMIGAGSVVASDVPDHTLVYGNPAQIKAFLCRCRQKLSFKSHRATCTSCGDKYHRGKSGEITQIS